MVLLLMLMMMRVYPGLSNYACRLVMMVMRAFHSLDCGSTGASAQTQNSDSNSMQSSQVSKLQLLYCCGTFRFKDGRDPVKVILPKWDPPARQMEVQVVL